MIGNMEDAAWAVLNIWGFPCRYSSWDASRLSPRSWCLWPLHMYYEWLLTTSGPGRAFSLVCLCDWTVTFELGNIWPRYSSRWFTLTLSRSCLQVKGKVQSHRRKNVAKVVGATVGRAFDCCMNCLMNALWHSDSLNNALEHSRSK